MKREIDVGALVFGLLFILLGIGLLLSNIYDFSLWSIIATYWPAFLIIIGLLILIKHYEK